MQSDHDVFKQMKVKRAHLWAIADERFVIAGKLTVGVTPPTDLSVAKALRLDHKRLSFRALSVGQSGGAVRC